MTSNQERELILYYGEGLSSSDYATSIPSTTNRSEASGLLACSAYFLAGLESISFT